MRRTGVCPVPAQGFCRPTLQTILLSQISFKGIPPLAPEVHPTPAPCPNPPAPRSTIIITRYHGDAQTPDVGLHAVSLLVEFWVYSLGLERRQNKTSDDILGSEKSRGWGGSEPLTCLPGQESHSRQ